MTNSDIAWGLCRNAEQTRQALTAEFGSERAALLSELDHSRQGMLEAKRAYAKEMESLNKQSSVLLDARPDADQYNQVGHCIINAMWIALSHQQQPFSRSSCIHAG